jgi:hypothetical protein
MTRRRTLSSIAAALCTIALGVVPAQASPGDALAKGAAGSVNATVDGEAVTVGAVAPCDTAGPPQGSSGEVAVTGVVTFGSATSTCTVDAAGELASVEVKGGRLRIDALLDHGGPRIRLYSYMARCNTTLTGSSSRVQFSGASGFEVPSELPANHVITIPGASGQPPLATITLNETIVPSPADGSMTVNLMHVRLFPQGGPDKGDIVVGTVHCAPVD